MASDLYKIARLINDARFVMLVEAAMLKYAQSIDLTAPLNPTKNLGIWVLKNPMTPEISMIALVASDTTVLAATTLNGDLTGTEDVPDVAIYNAVAAKWGIVATKFVNYSVTSGNTGSATA